MSVKITDSLGTEYLAQLFFVSPQQINYLLPRSLARGLARGLVLNNNQQVAFGALQIAAVAPGLFAANGQDVPAAAALLVRANGAQVFAPVARFDAGQNRFVPVPLNLDVMGERVFLLLYGTGLRFRTSLASVIATIGGVRAPVSFAGAQGQLAGLDQINLEVPRSLSGRGLVDVVLMVDGQTLNTVQVQIK